MMHDIIPRKERQHKERYLRPFMARGGDIALRPFPGYDVEVTSATPKQREPQTEISEALAQILHFNELLTDGGKAAEESYL